MGERKVPRPPAAVEVVGVAGLVVTCGSCTPDADTLRRWPVCFDFDFNMLTALKGWVGLAPVGGRVPSILLETLFMGGVPSIIIIGTLPPKTAFLSEFEGFRKVRRTSIILW